MSLSLPLPPPPQLAALVAACAFIAWAVASRDKTVGALAQVGGLQERELSRRALAASATAPASAAAAARRALLERACFTAGVANVALTMWIIGAAPTRFFLWHTPKSVLLISSRWLAFVAERPPRHLLLLDFCYVTNLLALGYLWLAPHRADIFKVIFVCSNGPLAWSVLAFNQALVFHSWQHITSVFVHVSPMLLTYGLRWARDADFSVCAGGAPACPPAAAAAIGEDESAAGLVWLALRNFYAPWLAGYYFFVFVVLGRYIFERGFQTLFDRVSTSGPLAPLLRRLTREGESELRLLKKTAYIAVHGAFGTLTMLLAAAVLWTSQAAHLCFIIAICTASAWNASSFYFVEFGAAGAGRPAAGGGGAAPAVAAAAAAVAAAAAAAGENSAARRPQGARQNSVASPR